MLARNKNSSLLRKFVNYGQKKIDNFSPWAVFTTLYFLPNLRMGPISKSVFNYQAFPA
jgi:hypothetical protein